MAPLEAWTQWQGEPPACQAPDPAPWIGGSHGGLGLGCWGPLCPPGSALAVGGTAWEEAPVAPVLPCCVGRGCGRVSGCTAGAGGD